jgi:hypothetical protein
VLDLTTVAIVLDPDYGSELLAVAALHPVWIVDSPANRPMIEAVWAERRAAKVPREVNVFRAIDGLSPAEHVAALMRSVDAAHGPSAQDPAYRTLVVQGVALDDALNALLLARGATSTWPTTHGFTAIFERS